MKKVFLSVVVPCFNEQEVLPLFIEAMRDAVIEPLEGKKIEIIFVNDGSRDETGEVLRKIVDENEFVRVIAFSRNFGKEAAILAGLEKSKGELVVVMDADLQDPPNKIPEMIKYIQKDDYDMVGLRRVTRKGEPPIRSFFARCFYRIINRISKTEMVDGARDYRMMTRRVVEALLEFREYNRYSKGLYGFVGFKTKWIEYENVERAAGETKWSFWKLWVYAVDGIVSFSTVPLTVFAMIGVIMCIIAFLGVLFVIIKTLIIGDDVGGWPSLICTLLFLSGIQLLALGVIGKYLANTYLETKHRPHYIIDEKQSYRIDGC